MDEYILDLDTLSTMLTNVLNRIERLAPEEIAVMMDNDNLEETILETIGVSRKLLSPEEQERFTALLRYVLSNVLKR